MALTQQQRDVLKLIERTKTGADGWKSCAPKIYEQLIRFAPDDLVEKRSEPLGVKFTDEGLVVMKWLLE